MHGVSEQDEIDYWQKCADDRARELAAIKELLNMAGVPAIDKPNVDQSRAEWLAIPERIALLIRDRNEARMLARDARIQAEDRGTSFQSAIAKLARYERVVDAARVLYVEDQADALMGGGLCPSFSATRTALAALYAALDALDAEDGQ